MSDSVRFGFRVRSNGAYHNESADRARGAIVDQADGGILVYVYGFIGSSTSSRPRRKDHCIQSREKLLDPMLEVSHHGRHSHRGELGLLHGIPNQGNR